MDKINLNKLRTQQEEQRAIHSVYDKIVREFVSLEHIGEDSSKPDFRLNYNGKKICIEMTRIEPYKNMGYESQSTIQDAVAKIIRKKIKEEGMNPICSIHIILGPFLSKIKIGTKIKKNKGIEKIIGAALKGRVNHDYFTEFKKNSLIRTKAQKEDAKYKATLQLISRFSGKPLPEINFSNPMMMINHISEEDITKAITHKEGHYKEYKNNSDESFEEIWLCIYIPRSEYGFTIRGASIPTIVTQYDRVYLAEEDSIFSRLIYSKNPNVKLDV